VRAKRQSQGFTLIEMAVVLTIAVLVSWLAYTTMHKDRPRANLASAAAELQALLHQARQTALGTSNPVAVLIYPNYAAPTAATVAATGYFVIYQDACFDFFTATAPTCGVRYANFTPTSTPGASGPLQSVIVDTMGLPRGVIVGPATGMGASATLPFPLASVTVNVACSFCGTTGGAVSFDSAGKASFYSLSGTTVTGPLGVSGGSLSLGYDPNVTDATGMRTLIIMSLSGAVQLINNG
jgi:prepilin-type N-terminal cleavage/methylation domain-containing protein